MLCTVQGCMDASACNYNTAAANDDGSCLFLDGICESCVSGAVVDNDSDDDGVCNDEGKTLFKSVMHR